MSSEVDNLLICGGPGTGKTGILSDYAVSLIHALPENDRRKILALSFKRHGANDIFQRLQKRLTEDEINRFESLTIDSFAKELLDRFYHLLPDFWKPSGNYLVDEELFDPLIIKDKFYAAAGTVFPAKDIEAVSPWDFCYTFMTNDVLPAEVIWSGICNIDIRFYMWQYFLKQQPSRLDFPMITALAELLVRINPVIKQLLSATYSCILLDEFQDVTTVHYQFLLTAFSGIRVIAAGDQNQNIMRWAHAMPDNFEYFRQDFNAREVQLNINTRSALKLLDIQNAVAAELNNDTEPMTADDPERTDGVCRALLFASDAEESRFIAAEAEKLMAEQLSLREICVIVRDTPEAYVKMWNSYLEGKNFRFRDESTIQRLLTEPAIQLLLALWENAFADGANDLLLRYLTAVNGIIGEDAKTLLTAFSGQLRQRFGTEDILPEKLPELLEDSINFLDRSKLKALYPRYRQGTWLENIAAELQSQMRRNPAGEKTLARLAVNFRNGNFIPVTTIQQCKFFEAHTVFFTGWEDQEQWEYSTDENEELCGFLIAVSRAKEQLFFTAAMERWENETTIDRIRKIYDILLNNGVKLQLIRDME